MLEQWISRSQRSTESFPIVIIGTGFSGIGTGVMLKKAGIDSFTILEKASDIGGTWRDNAYPGAACDVPSHLYSFSFEPKPDWSRAYSPQQEIQSYLRHCVTKYDLAKHIRFHSEVTGAEFDESTGSWTVRIAGREPLRARAVVLGNGALSIPSTPDILGLEEFSGKVFHSARWDHDYDLEGKTVAVVGTGASSIQFVPQIQPKTGQLHLFQRTPPWILPKPDRAMTGREQWLFAKMPFLRRLHRAWIYWTHELRVLGFVVDPRIMELLEKLAKRYVASIVEDPALRAKLTPSYTMGCKRILISNDYYQALVQPNVEVVTDAIERVTREGIITRDGAERKVDAIICGTGFTATDYLAPLRLIGRGGKNLNDVLQQNGESHLGITVSGFPNLYLLMGPNTGLGHNSMIFMIETQAAYAVQAIRALRDRSLVSLDVRGEVQRASSQRVQARLQRSVWSSGCQSWYLKDGRNGTLWPGFTFAYWWQARKLRFDDFDAVPFPAEEVLTVPQPMPAT
jgi:cation diffusion facilitator CzcD-associated flavoprotein CzcO